MLKKFVSNALLSVVMDKSARSKLAERKAEDTPTPPKRPKKSSEIESDEDVLATISDALAAAREEISSVAPSNGTRKRKKRFEPAPPVRTAPPGKSTDRKAAGSTEREELIKHALSVHRQKQQVLDDLPTETREKLMFMAMHAMDPDSLPPDARRIVEAEIEAEKMASGAPVDDIGSAAKPRRRKR